MEKLKVVVKDMYNFDGSNEKFNMEIHNGITPAYEFGDNDLIFFNGLPKTKEMFDIIENFFKERQTHNEFYGDIAEELEKEFEKEYKDCHHYFPSGGIATLEDYGGMIAVEIIDGNINVFEFDESTCFVMAYPSYKFNVEYDVLHDGTVEEISVSESCVCLDEWDGSNFVTETVGIHEYVHIGKDEDGDTSYYIKRESQWQNSLDCLAKFDTKNDVLEYIENLSDCDRDMDKYKEDIDELVFD